MDRRGFLRRLTAAGAAGAAVDVVGCGSRTPAPSTSSATARVTYRVQGFTCITCAVGLETMLRAVHGVTEVTASYAENTVIIGFDGRVIGEDALTQFISDCGFSVAA